MSSPELDTHVSALGRDEFDVVVVGAGAGGLAAAVTAAAGGASVLLLESAPVCGGATAWSGGWLFAPRSILAKADGVNETKEEVAAYLKAVMGDDYDGVRVDAFLEAAPEMIEFFHTRTAMKFVPGAKIHDIYGNLPHAGTGNRSVGAKPINARRLSKNVRRLLRGQLYETSFLGMGIMAGPDLAGFLAASRGNFSGLIHAARRVTVHIWDLLFHRRAMQLVNGTALVGRLLQSAEDVGVNIRVNSPVEQLVTENGKVIGVVARTPEGQQTFLARSGVVLAGGGFPHDIERRRERFPRTPTGTEHWTLAPESADGSGISLGESVGGILVQGASAGAWCPVSLIDYRLSARQGVFPHIMDRAKPGSIGVLSTGKRFVNEANGYHDYVTAMFESVPEGEPIQSWQIADSRFVRKFPLGMAKPLPVPLFPYLRNGYLVKGRTLEELARKCGIDATALKSTVVAFNADAERGVDSEFGRGKTGFNRYGGDPTNHPSPTLGPIDRGPFYATRVLPGSFGTFAGLATDAEARVINSSGQPIRGLYAAGADQANVMGGHYPAGGTNIGPALTFGFIAGRALARMNVEETLG